MGDDFRGQPARVVGRDRRRDGGVVHDAGQVEVGYLDFPVFVDHQIGAFEISVAALTTGRTLVWGQQY